MPQCFDKLEFAVGNADILSGMGDTVPLAPFSDEVIEFLDAVAASIMKYPESKDFPDVFTFGFWCRKSSMTRMKTGYSDMLANELRQGRGVAFHIAPSNVAVNFAYSLAAGLISGNANIVRLPSKTFRQTELIYGAILAALDKLPHMQRYIILVRYKRDRDINDALSAMCDTRIVWGGDETIRTIRLSPIPPRAKEVNFADRYSVCVINSDIYLSSADFAAVADSFYNDTYLTDQNACSSPKLLVWLGDRKPEAQMHFWTALQDAVIRKAYELSPAQAVQKLGMQCELAMVVAGVQASPHSGSLVTVMRLDRLSEQVIEFCGHSGFFIEYDASELEELLLVCSKKCQTLAYYGFEKDEIALFLRKDRPQGVDRAVPIGHTMDFDLTWDGYDLVREMTRVKQVL